jgi:hypothetical protein
MVVGSTDDFEQIKIYNPDEKKELTVFACDVEAV